MLVKLNKKDKNGNELYQMVNMLGLDKGCTKVFGSVGTIAQLMPAQAPSERYGRRHEQVERSVIHSNRKSTLGRQFYFQQILLKDKNGKWNGLIKTVKHVQETASAIARKTAVIEFNEKIQIAKSKFFHAHPEFRRS